MRCNPFSLLLPGVVCIVQAMDAAHACEPAAPRTAWVSRWGGALGLLLVLWPWLQLPYQTYFPSAVRDALLPLFSALLLLSAALLPAVWSALVARWRGLTGLGRFGLGATGLFLIWQGVAAANGAEPLAARLGWFRALQFSTVTAVVALQAGTEARRNGLLRALGLAGGLVGLCALVAHGAGWQWAYYTASRMHFPFSMPAALGAFAMVCALVAVARLHDAVLQRSRSLLWWVAAFALALTAFWQARTISTFVGFLAGLWVLVWTRVPARRAFLVLSLLVAGGLGAGVGWYLTTPVGREWMLGSSWGTRPLFVQTALTMAQERPLLGWGPMTYPYAQAFCESTTTYLSAQRGAWSYAVHCEPAQVLGELGIPGLLLWLAVLGLGIATAWRAWMRETPSVTAPHLNTGGAALMLLTAVTVDGLFSPAYRQLDTGTMGALVLGFALAAGAQAQPLDSPSRPGVRFLLLPLGLLVACLAVAGVVGQVHLAVAAKKYRDVMKTQVADGWAVVAERGRQATAWAADIDLYQRSVGYRLRALDRLGRYDAGVALCREALERVPVIDTFVHRLASLEERRGRPGGQFVALVRGLHYQPYHHEYRERLRRLLAVLDAQLLTYLETWEDHPELDREAVEPLGNLVGADWVYLRAELDFSHGRVEPALGALARLDPAAVRIVPLPSEYGRMLVLAGRTTEAVAVLEPACARVPADPDALYWLARARVEAGGSDNLASAHRLLQRALTRRASHPDAAILFSQFCMADGQYAEAEAVLRRALGDNRRVARLQKALVETLLHLEREAEALGALAEARRLLPASAQLRALQSRLRAAGLPVEEPTLPAPASARGR